jgi:guanine deaminase
MALLPGNQLFVGTFIHSKSREELEYLHEAAVCVDRNGKIVAVERDTDEARAVAVLYPRLGWSADEVMVYRCEEGQFFFPGFIGKTSPFPPM